MKSCPGIVMPCGDNCPGPAYAYVPVQDVDRFFNYESAFITGTVFPDLNIPKGKYGPNENAFS